MRRCEVPRKICLAQVRSEKVEVQTNIDHHLEVLRRIGPDQADLVVFPELSLSNYDPDIAASVALAAGDSRLAVFRRHADETGTTVAVGAPLRTEARPYIALLVFEPGTEPAVVGKRHLHPDEEPFFAPWRGAVTILDLSLPVGIAICYEISVGEHIDALVADGAGLLLASVAKTPEGVADARTTLERISRRYDIPALMVNSVGTCEGRESGGSSMAIDRTGRVLARLDAVSEGLLTFDVATGAAVTSRLSLPPR
jgi:predicted amidohydrolase